MVDKREEMVFEGYGVGPGVAVGVVHVNDAGIVAVPEYRIPVSRLEAECRRFQEAVEKANRQLSRLQSKARAIKGAAGEELGYLLDAYAHMLKGSRLIRGVETRIREERINAEAAVQHEIAEIIAGFAAMEDAYLAARMEDIREIGRRLIRNLTRAEYRPFSMLPKRAVIVAEELTPADTALLDPRVVAGFATVLGGAESHTAIMARSLELPAVVGLQGLFGAARSGDPIIIDGNAGRVILNPTPRSLAAARKKRADYLQYRRALGRLRSLPAVTRDGVGISLQSNIELPTELDGVLQSGAEGIGLLRSEFMFMNRDTVPSEDEQYAVLSEIVERMGRKPVTIRTLDAGGDKVGRCLGLPAGPNPALGLRAVRLAETHPEVVETQLAAILRAAAHGAVRILVPMVATVAEMTRMRRIMDKVVRRLQRRRTPLPDPLPPLGVMIEVPGAALSADALAMHSDFSSIGTNDLTQYTLAIDRTDESVAGLFDPLHPAVLRLIQFSAEAALRARIPVSLCGEMAGDRRYTPLLLGLGIRDLSMAAMNVPRVKQRIRKLDLLSATTCAHSIMEQFDPVRIARLLDSYNRQNKS